MILNLPDSSNELSVPLQKTESINAMERQLDYWKARLADSPTLELHTDKPRPAIQSFRGGIQRFSLSPDLAAGLKVLSQREGVTLFMTLLAAFEVLLHRYSGQDDIVIGTPTAGRGRSELEGLIGIFINTLLLRVDLSGNPSFLQLLGQVREITLGAYANQDLPFEKLVEALHPQRGRSRNPLFQVMFVMQNTAHSELLLNNLAVESLSVIEEGAKFDLTVYVEETLQGTEGYVTYATDLFEAATITRLIGHFQTLLEGIVAHPESHLSELPLLTEPERRQLSLPDPTIEILDTLQKPVTEKFLEWAEQRPEMIAVSQGIRQWTYGELADKANALAIYLHRHDLHKGDVIAILGPRSFGTVTSMLAVLMAGGVFITIDSALPITRQRLIAKEASVKALLCCGGENSSWRDWQNEEPDLQLISIDTETGALIGADYPFFSGKNELPLIKSNDAAYIFFTSGSTGTPKGILGVHKGLSHFINWQRDRFSISPGDRVSQLTNLAFDVVMRDVFLPLTSGATVCLPEDGDLLNPLHWLAKQLISVAHTTPSLLQFWLAQNKDPVDLSALRWLFVAGEPLTDALICKWRHFFPDYGRMVNLYGPTETTLAKCFYQIPQQISPGIQPIGNPLPETQALIIGQDGRLCSIGEPGEIVLRTPFRTYGYINLPEETQRKFRKNPFRNDDTDLLYFTGDQGRYRLDGLLEISGRIDDQVKIRGVRIEPAEVMASLARHDAVENCYVLAIKNEEGQSELVAYVVLKPQKTTDSGHLRAYLGNQLPAPYIPGIFVFVDNLPRLPNGKVDSKALPAPELNQQEMEVDFVAPRNSVEKLLAGIWCNVLRIDRVGIDDNFFELGGNSLLAMQVIVRAEEKLSVDIPLSALFELPTIGELVKLIENAAVRAPNHSKRITPQRQSAFKSDNSTADLFLIPASFPQQELWLVDKLAGTTVNYIISRMFRLQGRLDIGCLEAAINEIIRRHETLRTFFAEQNGKPVQVIQSSLSIPLTTVDFRGYPEQRRASEVARLVQANVGTSFNLERLPLLRFQLLRLGEEEYIFLLAFHHIIYDGWSMDVFARELSALYRAFSQGQPSPVPELPIQYADYAVWQREQLQGEVMEKLLAYWKARLAGVPTLELPTDRPRPAVQSFRGATRQFSLPSDLAEGLNALSRCEGVTLFMTLAAAFQVLLHRYSAQDDIAIGTPSAGRSCLELEGLIGFFVNTLVLRADLSSDPGFRELLAQVREVALGAYTNQDMPFEKLVEALNPQRDPSRNPLFQVMFALQNAPDDKLQLNEITAEIIPVDNRTTQFDLTLDLFETADGGLSGGVEYAIDLFDAATIGRLISHFHTLLEGIVAHPEARLSELPLLTEFERQQLLVEWNDTATSFPGDKCIHELFEAQAAATPHAVAVMYESSQLTYAELNAQANQLAHHLRGLGVKPDALVAICVERCLNMVVGLLAILKAGGAYVPLDPAYPKDRLAFMLEDSNPLVLLAQGRFKNLLTGMTIAVPMTDLDADFPMWANQPNTNLDCHDLGLAPTHLAYVIYTSGSTGKPKGVMIEHKEVINMITDLKNRYQICTEDRILQFAPIAFDVSVEEIFVTLLSGAALVLRSDDWIAGASKFWALCEKKGVSVVNLPTLFWQQLVQEDQAVIPTTIRQIIIGSEAVNSKVLADWFERESYRPKLFNAYGPTETTVNATIHEPSTDSLSWQSIGRPIANTCIYILDANNQPVPIGLAGELYIGGTGIARGYLNRPDLTSERFVDDPFSAEADARMYKTGDLARWLVDGTIEFLGRNDFQVKIRGFRIELGDIEVKLAEHPAVREVAVLAREDSDGDKRLVAYLVPQDNFIPSVLELRDFLKKKIPEFMVPSAFVFLEALPLTPNGKLDRKALPVPDQGRRELDHDFVAPRSSVEKQLAEIWSNILRIDRVGIHDNFFVLGGHSLLAVTLVVEVNKRFNTNLPLGAIYQYQTVEELEIMLSSGKQQPSWYSLVPIQTQGSRPPLFAIHTISLLDLPKHLGKDQPLYFLRYGMAGENSNSSVRLPQLTELASHYIEEMQQVQPHGPYYLMGFSFGGLIAYEMACQLIANGHQVNFVGLLDTYLTSEKQWLPYHRIIHNFFRLRPRRLLAMVKNKITDLTTPSQYGTDFWPLIYTSAPDEACRFGYQPKSYNGGRISLFQGVTSERLFSCYRLPESAWKILLGDRLEVQQVTGSHIDICKEPHVKILAEKLIACMDETIKDRT